MSQDLKSKIIKLVTAWVQEQNIDSSQLHIYLEDQKEKKFGDWSLNIAMKLAKECRKAPVQIAEQIKAYLNEKFIDLNISDSIKNIEIKPPGFINIFLSDLAFYDILRNVGIQKDDFGRNDEGKGGKVLIEFVSANPTGPLSIAHARQAAVGDSLANIMEFSGFDVNREYYLNDEGNQINNLGLSLEARYREDSGAKGVEFPKDGYKGHYLQEQAKEIIGKLKNKEIDSEILQLPFFRDYAVEKILIEIKDHLHKFGVDFDEWFSQKELSKSGEIEKTLDELKDKKFIYEKDGAVWFKSSEFDDDKDRVLIKSDGEFTYLTPDIAYHKLKFERGYNKLINIWGPDHHGYINRLKASVSALGYESKNVSIVIIQLATLFRDGKPVVMSTRAGEYITLKELLDEVGKDAARFFFLMRKCDSQLEFDLELAKKKTLDNPVYYIQYAHARISGVLSQKDERLKTTDGEYIDLSMFADFTDKQVNIELLKEEEEIDLIRLINHFSAVLVDCTVTLDPQGLTTYLRELAGQFHTFYSKHRVISEDKELSLARVVLICCARQVIRNGLNLLGVQAPEKM
ncbi:MAG: arginine--tRNA ligase [PVC group bacterium]|nr:arginine--tRNA ligase [PVC group bacterium]